MLLIQGFNFSQLLPITNGYVFKWTLGKSHIKIIKKFLKIPMAPEAVIEEGLTIQCPSGKRQNYKQWCSSELNAFFVVLLACKSVDRSTFYTPIKLQTKMHSILIIKCIQFLQLHLNHTNI
jgi:hypothetical protein